MPCQGKDFVLTAAALFRPGKTGQFLFSGREARPARRRMLYAVFKDRGALVLPPKRTKQFILSEIGVGGQRNYPGNCPVRFGAHGIYRPPAGLKGLLFFTLAPEQRANVNKRLRVAAIKLKSAAEQIRRSRLPVTDLYGRGIGQGLGLRPVAGAGGAVRDMPFPGKGPATPEVLFAAGKPPSARLRPRRAEKLPESRVAASRKRLRAISSLSRAKRASPPREEPAATLHQGMGAFILSERENPEDVGRRAVTYTRRGAGYSRQFPRVALRQQYVAGHVWMVAVGKKGQTRYSARRRGFEDLNRVHQRHAVFRSKGPDNGVLAAGRAPENYHPRSGRQLCAGPFWLRTCALVKAGAFPCDIQDRPATPAVPPVRRNNLRRAETRPTPLRLFQTPPDQRRPYLRPLWTGRA